MNDVSAPGREVTLRDVPVRLYREAQQHTDALLRELVLMAEYETSQAGGEGPIRSLFTRANDGFADRLDLTVRAAPDIDAAVSRGESAVTLVFTLPERYATSTEAWTRVLDELDGLCRDGTMLMVPASAEVAAFAKWWCGEFVRQLRDGAAPTPWSAYRAAVDAAR